MTLKRIIYPGQTIELATDPASNSGYTIYAGSLWLDTSTDPAVLRKRNSANTTWSEINAQGLGSFTDTFTLSTGQTSVALTHTPASQSDLLVFITGVLQDPNNISSVSEKTVNFASAIPANLNNRTMAVYYTRTD